MYATCIVKCIAYEATNNADDAKRNGGRDAQMMKKGGRERKKMEKKKKKKRKIEITENYCELQLRFKQLECVSILPTNVAHFFLTLFLSANFFVL